MLGFYSKLSSNPQCRIGVRNGACCCEYGSAACKQCVSTHFQDPGQCASVVLPRGPPFESRSTWTDLYVSICEARHLIYIAGWSISDKIHLVRDPTKPIEQGIWPSLGQPRSLKSSLPWRLLPRRGSFSGSNRSYNPRRSMPTAVCMLSTQESCSCGKQRKVSGYSYYSGTTKRLSTTPSCNDTAS